MKLKYLMMVSLMLAIITIGAVSASEASDELAVDEISEDSIVGSGVDEDVISETKDVNGIEFDIANKINTNEQSTTTMASVYEIDDYFDGTITLSIDNTQYFSEYYRYDELIDYVEISVSDLTLPDNLKSGTHTVMLSYLKNGVSTPYSYSQKSNFSYAPNVVPQDNFGSVGDTAYLFIKGLSGSSGTAILYDYDDVSGKIGSKVATVAIVDGKAKIPVSGLAKGVHSFYLNMTVDGQVYEDYAKIGVIQNAAGNSASVSPSVVLGSDATVTFTASKKYGAVYIYVDGNEYKNIIYDGGALSENVHGLSSGEHIISVIYYRENIGYVKNFNVNVHSPVPKDTVSLVLKTVKVKKSAKKLVLQATLKINSKAGAGKKVTFTFNGKKFTGTANKNGVAKVTVKSKVLKKLKVGKKVTYQERTL